MQLCNALTDKSGIQCSISKGENRINLYWAFPSFIITLRQSCISNTFLYLSKSSTDLLDCFFTCFKKCLPQAESFRHFIWFYKKNVFNFIKECSSSKLIYMSTVRNILQKKGNLVFSISPDSSVYDAT